MLDVSELIDDLRERLKPLKTRLFPQQVLLELSDTAVVGQPIVNGRPGPIAIDVPLPALTCKGGVPIEIEPLADLIGDLLVRENLIDAHVLAALPQVAVEWRVIDWAGQAVPEDGVAELRRLNPDLGLPYPLEAAALDLQPLAGAPGAHLLASTRREVVEGWISVFNQAGTILDRLACPQSCRLAALRPALEEIPAGTLVVLVTAREEAGHLMAMRDGMPLFDWPLPVESEAMAREAKRCVAFLRREFGGVRSVRLWLEGPLEGQAELEAALDLPALTIASEPYGSLVMQGLAIPERLP